MLLRRFARSFAILTLASTALAGSLRAAADEDLATMLPADSLLYVSVPDVASTQKEGKNTAIWKIMHDEEVQAFLKPLEDMAKEQGEAQGLGAMMTELESLLKGVELSHFGLAVTHVDMAEIQQGPEGLGLVIDLGIAGSSSRDEVLGKLESMIKEFASSQGEELESGETKISEKTIRTVGNDEGRIYRYDATATRTFFSFSRKSVEGLISGPAGGNSLAKSAGFQKVSARTSASGDEVRLFMNTQAIGTMISMVAPMDNVDKILGYFMPGALSMGMKFDGDLVRTSTFLSRPAGGMKVLDLLPSKPIPADSLKAVPKDAMMAGLFAIEAEKVWPFITGFADTVEPGASKQLEEQLAGVKEMIGVDIKADLLEQLSGSFMYYASAPKGPLPIPGLVMALGIKDTAKAKKTLNTLLELAGDEIQVRGVSYKENTFYTVTAAGGMMPVQPAYAFTDDHLLFALNSQDIKIALSRAGGDAKSSLLDSDAFKKAKANAGLPGSFTALNYIDMETFGGIVYNSMLQGIQMLAMSGMADQIPLDFALLPSSEAITQHLFPSLSYSVCDQDGMLLKSASPIGDEMLMLTAVSTMALPAAFMSGRSMAYSEMEAAEAVEMAEALSAGEMAPDWSLKTPAGEGISLSQLRGEVVVIDFWATWCPPCREAMPSVQKLHEKYKARGVKFYGIATWESGDPAAFMKENGYTYSLLLGGDDAANAYNVSGIPALFVIDKNGRIALAESGFNADSRGDFEAGISEAIEASLGN